jgi:hypothetical protein
MSESVRTSSPANGHFQRANPYGKKMKALEMGWWVLIYPVDEDSTIL